MPILEIIESIYSIAKKVRNRSKLVKANMAQCNTLADRVDIVIAAVNNLEKAANKEQYEPGLIAFELCLKECLEFVDEYAKEKSWFKKILKAGTAKEKFEDLNEQLQKAIQQLSLGLNAQAIINHEQDRKDQEKDQAFNNQQQELIIRLNQEANKGIQKLQVQQAEGNAILFNQMKSMQAQLARFNIQAKEKPIIDAYLTTPYYELAFDQELAKGSFGKIYLGKWCEQRVAIKTIEGGLSNAEMDQFVREVQIMSRLRSPNIVELYGACLERERPCLIMQYMEQGSLYLVLGQKKLTVLEQKKIALDIAKGLWYLHSKEVSHRDLKSANILLDNDGHAKIADFGLSKTGSKSIQSIHESSSALEWQAPECLAQNAPYSPEADIYSYGMILWEIVTNKRPYAQYSSSKRDAEIVEHVLKGQRETIPKDTPAPLVELIQACWSPNPKQRPHLKKIIEVLESYQPEEKLSPEAIYQKGVQFEQAGKLIEAYAEYQKSASCGHPKAHTNAGFFLLKGLPGLKPDKPAAFQHFLQSANSGHVRGMMNLAIMLEKGDGVDKSPEQALHWYEQAAKNGDEKGKLKSLALSKSHA